MVAIVPARDEAELIGPVLKSLLNQSVAMRVILVDDESTDGTADVARRASEEAGKADALIVIRSKPLPVGWTGKLWAMHQGVEYARASNPTWLMLTDADVLHGPDTVANLGLIASQCRLRSGFVHGEAALRKPPGKIAHSRLRIFLFHALPASLDSQCPALDRRRGRGLHAGESGNFGTSRRAGIHSRRRYRRLLAGPAPKAAWREIVARINRSEPEFATIRDLLGRRAHGLAHGLQPIEALVAVAAGHNRGNDDYLSRASAVVVKLATG